MSVSLQSALELVQKAVNLDNNGKGQEAISMYSIAIDHLRQVSSSSTIDQSTRVLIDSKILEYQNRSNFLKSSLHLDYSNSGINNSGHINNSNNNISPPQLQQQQQVQLNKSNGTNLVDEALKFANEAVSCESKNQISNAILYYRKCSELLEKASTSESDIETRLFLNQKKQEYQSRAEQLELQNPQLKQSIGMNNSGGSGSGGGGFNNNNNMNTSIGMNTSGNFGMNNSNNGFSKNNLPFPQAEEEYSMYSQIEQQNNTGELIDLAISCVKEAIKEDDHLNYDKAIHYYDLSVQYFQTVLNNGGGGDPKIKQLICEKMVNSQSRSQFLKNKTQYNQNKTNNEYDSIPFALRPGQKYKDPVRKKTVLERLQKTIKGPVNISDKWL